MRFNSIISQYQALNQSGAIRANDLFNVCVPFLDKNVISLYVDIGTGTGHNTRVFASLSEQTVGLDLKIFASNKLAAIKNIHLLAGDGTRLPFPNQVVDVMSLFSVIEHIPEQNKLIKEVFRTLKPNGVLLIQVPNRLFPIELHSYIPLFFYFPKFIRRYLAKAYKRTWVNDVDIPRISSLVKMVHCESETSEIIVKQMNYSPEVLTPIIKSVYTFFLKLKLLRIVPLGYVVIVKK